MRISYLSQLETRVVSFFVVNYKHVALFWHCWNLSFGAYLRTFVCLTQFACTYVKHISKIFQQNRSFLYEEISGTKSFNKHLTHNAKITLCPCQPTINYSRVCVSRFHISDRNIFLTNTSYGELQLCGSYTLLGAISKVWLSHSFNQ